MPAQAKNGPPTTAARPSWRDSSGDFPKANEPDANPGLDWQDAESMLSQKSVRTRNTTKILNKMTTRRIDIVLYLLGTSKALKSVGFSCCGFGEPGPIGDEAKQQPFLALKA